MLVNNTEGKRCVLVQLLKSILLEEFILPDEHVNKLAYFILFSKLVFYRRVFTALIRLQADSNRILFFIGDLLKKPLLPNELHVIAGVASIWPAPFQRKNGGLILSNKRLNKMALEGQILSYTLEVVVMFIYRSRGKNAGIQESVSC